MSPVESMSNVDLDAIAIEQESGAGILGGIDRFLGRFIVYPSAHARTAHTLWIAHVHLLVAFDSTPRLCFLSAEPASGKTRALEITELLVPRPIEAVNISPAALFRLTGAEDGLPTILFDEIDTIFGAKTRENNEEIRGLLNAGHRRGAKTYRCIMHGKKAEVEEIEAFAAVALAGLGWLPDTIMTRSIIVRMKRRASGERVEPYRRRNFLHEGHCLRDRLTSWAAEVVHEVRDVRPAMPAGIVDRAADVWEPLFAVADAAGGDWPERARNAATAMLREANTDHLPSLGVQLLADLRSIWGDVTSKATDDLLNALCAIPESPWADMRGKPIDARRLANLLRQYGVKPKVLRIGSATPRGYVRDDLLDAWDRNLSALLEKSATSATSATNVSDQRVVQLRRQASVADDAQHVSDADSKKLLQNGCVADVALVAAIPGEGVSSDLSDAFEERAAILEFDGGLTRQEAEAGARHECGIATPGTNR